MQRYVVLLKFTQQGESKISDSPQRAKAFTDRAAKAGAKVEAQYWTVGPYDGVLILSAPDESTAAGLVLGLGRDANVATCMLRACDAGEFQSILNKMG